MPQYVTSRRLGHRVGIAGGHEIPLVQENNMIEAHAGPDPGVIKKQDKSGFGHGTVASGITSTVVVTQS